MRFDGGATHHENAQRLVDHDCNPAILPSGADLAQPHTRRVLTPQEESRYLAQHQPVVLG